METPENRHTEQPAAHEQPQLTRDEIVVNYRDRASEQSQLPVDLPKTVTELYPRFIHEEVVRELAELHDTFPELQSVPANRMRLHAQRCAAALRDAMYTYDDLTKLPNKNYVRKLLAEIVDSQLRDTNNHSYEHVAHISIDLNGLKAVNDLNGGQHSFGDEYLKIVADWLWESRVLNNLKRSGAATINRARAGGDEFQLTIVARPDATDNWNEFWTDVQIKLQLELERLDVSSVIPREVIQREFPDAPEDFTFRAKAGIGLVTLEAALAETEDLGKNTIYENDAPESMRNALMGRLLDMSDRAMDEHKRFYKDKRAASSSPNERMLERIYARTEEQKLSDRRVKELQHRNALLEAELAGRKDSTQAEA